MQEYTVFFELYGKRMKTRVMAENQEHAKRIIRGKIIFHEVDTSESRRQFEDDARNVIKDIKEIFGLT